MAIIDLGLPPDPDGVSEGFSTIEEILRLAPRTKIVVATGNGASLRVLQKCGFAIEEVRQSPASERYPACEEAVLVLR